MKPAKKLRGDDGERGRAGLTALLVFFLVLAVYFLYQAPFITGIKRLL